MSDKSNFIIQKDILGVEVLTKYIGSETTVTLPDGTSKISAHLFDGTNVESVYHYGADKNLVIYSSSDGYEFTGRCYFENSDPLFIDKSFLNACLSGFLEEYHKGKASGKTKEKYHIYFMQNRKKLYRSLDTDEFLLEYFTKERIILYSEIDGLIALNKSEKISSILQNYKNSFSAKEAERLSGLAPLTLADYKKYFGLIFAKKGSSYILKKSYDYIDSLVIPYSVNGITVTEIGKEAFHSCVNLHDVTIPESIEAIGNRAFCGCKGLVTADISEGLKTIGDYAFTHCESLESISFPCTLSYIGTDAFSFCVTNLKKCIYSGSVAEWCQIEMSGYASNPLEVGADLYINGKAVHEISADDLDGVTRIGDYAFAKYLNLKKITIPGTVETIGKKAFYECSNTAVIYYGTGINPESFVKKSGKFQGKCLFPNIDIDDIPKELKNSVIF